MLVIGPLPAEKILLTSYVVLLPLAARYAIRSMRPESSYLSLLIFPFVGNALFHMGFYNFCFSLAAYFLVLGFWMRHRRGPEARHVLSLAGLLVLLYLCHIVTLACAALAMGVLALWEVVLGRRLGRAGEALPGGRGVGWRGLIPLALAFVPVTALAIGFALTRSRRAPSVAPGPDLLVRLLRLDSLMTFKETEFYFSTAMALGLAALTAFALWGRRKGFQVRSQDGLLVVVGLYVLVYFVAPDKIMGGEFVSHRMNLFPALGLILWLAAERPGRWPRIGIQAVGVICSLGLLWIHSSVYRDLNLLLDEYLSGSELVATNSTILPLSYAHRGLAADGTPLSPRVGPFRHAAGYIAAERGLVDLANYEAVVDFFPLRWRPERNPAHHLAYSTGIEGRPPCVDIPSYTSKTGATVDYVLIWQLRQEMLDHPCVQSVLGQIEGGYDLILESPRTREMKLYRRKGFHPQTSSIH